MTRAIQVDRPEFAWRDIPCEADLALHEPRRQSMVGYTVAVSSLVTIFGMFRIMLTSAG